MPLKRKAKPSSVEDSTQYLSITSDVFDNNKQKRTRRKQDFEEHTISDDDSLAVMKQKSYSSNTEEVLGKSNSGA